MLIFLKKLTKFRFPFTGQLKYDCGPHRPRSCHLFFVRACVPNILSKCQTLGAQVYLCIPRPSTFPPTSPFHGLACLPPCSGSHSTTAAAIKHSDPARAMVSFGLDCFARNPYFFFFFSGGKMCMEKLCFKEGWAVLKGKSDPEHIKFCVFLTFHWEYSKGFGFLKTGKNRERACWHQNFGKPNRRKLNSNFAGGEMSPTSLYVQNTLKAQKLTETCPFEVMGKGEKSLKYH